MLPKSVYLKMAFALLLLGLPLFYIVQYKSKNDLKQDMLNLESLRKLDGLQNLHVKKDTVQKGEVYIHLFDINTSKGVLNPIPNLMDNVSMAISKFGFNFSNVEFMDLHIPVQDNLKSGKIRESVLQYFRNSKFKLEISYSKDSFYQISELEVIK